MKTILKTLLLISLFTFNSCTKEDEKEADKKDNTFYIIFNKIEEQPTNITMNNLTTNKSEDLTNSNFKIVTFSCFDDENSKYEIHEFTNNSYSSDDEVEFTFNFPQGIYHDIRFEENQPDDPKADKCIYWAKFSASYSHTGKILKLTN